MYTNESKVNATFQENGSVLVKKAEIRESKIRVINDSTGEYVILEKEQYIKPTVFKHATRNLVLGIDFIEDALTKPKEPKGNERFKFKKSKLGIASKNWKEISDIEKIRLALEEIAHDLHCTVINIEII